MENPAGSNRDGDPADAESHRPELPAMRPDGGSPPAELPKGQLTVRVELADAAIIQDMVMATHKRAWMQGFVAGRQGTPYWDRADWVEQAYDAEFGVKGEAPTEPLGLD